MTERERIIKLVKSQKWNSHTFFGPAGTYDCLCLDCDDVRLLVTLIEGEGQ